MRKEWRFMKAVDEHVFIQKLNQDKKMGLPKAHCKRRKCRPIYVTDILGV